MAFRRLPPPAQDDASARRSIYQAVATLPVEERAALVAVLSGAHTYQQAAWLLGEPAEAIRSRLRSALCRLAVTTSAGRRTTRATGQPLPAPERRS